VYGSFSSMAAANRADKKLAVFFRGFFQFFNVFFDIAGHFVEVFSQFADFRSAAHRRALVEFAAADSARGSREAANRFADAHGKKVPEEDGHQHHHADESQSLAVQFRHACVATGVIQAAFCNNRPIDLGECAVGANHLDGMLCPLFRKTNRLGIAEFLGQSANLLDQLSAGFGAGHEILRVGMRDDVARVIHHENFATAHAGVSQAV
jgi:hypothetical protein